MKLVGILDFLYYVDPTSAQVVVDHLNSRTRQRVLQFCAGVRQRIDAEKVPTAEQVRMNNSYSAIEGFITGDKLVPMETQAFMQSHVVD